MKKLSLLLLLAISAHGLLRAQVTAPTADTTHITIGQSVAALNGPWKFRTGDDPRWADPDFDDSSWETVDLTPKAGSFDPISGVSGFVPGWTANGHPGYWGYAWYRIRVQVNARPGQSLALAGPTDVDDAYQVFANGRLLGSFGKFSQPEKAPVIYNSQPMMFPLPQSSAGDSGILSVAFRVWMEPNTLIESPDVGGFHTAPQLGDATAVAANHQLAWLEYIRSYGWGAIEAALYFFLTLLACSLILLDRFDRVYWWLAAVFLLTAIERANLCLLAWSQVESLVVGTGTTDIFLRPAVLGIWVIVWWTWFRLRRPAWIPTLIALLTLLYATTNALGEDLFFNVIPHSVSAEFHLASVGIRILFLPLLIYIIIQGVREQGWDGWLALPAVILVGIAQFQAELAVLHVRTTWFPLGLQVSISQVANLTLVAVIFVLLIRRLLISLQQQRQLELDVKQAQEVQQVLIPEQLPLIPSLAIESEYRPAREVGGDFFQIIPHPSDGSVLIVAGDVTGKGLQAGMLVALIVGVIRNQADANPDPLATLYALNKRLCGRGHAHATCLALRIDADGSATLANAGHMPPYLNGKELHVEGALPLGMLLSAEFSVTRFQLEQNDRLMLLSDGVAEAQNEHGHLFGFDRIHELLAKPVTAAEVASAAQSFGQQDDISVLAITRTTVREHALA